MALMTRATDAGMHTEQLAGRTQQRFFRPEEESRFTYPHAFEVDYGKRAEFDAADLEPTQINLKLRELMSQGGKVSALRRRMDGCGPLHRQRAARGGRTRVAGFPGTRHNAKRSHRSKASDLFPQLINCGRKS